MKKLAIVCDSSVSLTPEQIKEKGITIVPVSLIHNNEEYLDEVTIDYHQVNDLLRKNEVITTSQPNVGSVIEVYERLIVDNVDHIFVLPLSHYLSGTMQSFVQAAEIMELKNITIIDTLTLVGPIQKGVDIINDLNSQDASIEEITNVLNNHFSHTETYVLPLDLKQLKASGRISPAAAAMASLLRIRPILKLENKGESIDKFGTARTDKRAIELIIDDLIKNNVTPQTHELYYLHSENEELIERLSAEINEKMGTFKSQIGRLPAALATHAGIGTIAVQYVLKDIKS